MRPARRFALLLASAAALLALVFLLLGPARPAALPPGATPLALPTQPGGLALPFGYGCPAVLIAPFRVARSGDEMVFTRVDNGDLLEVVWPAGWSARLLNGRAELVAPQGFVFARDGDVLTNVGGGSDINGDILVCFDYPPQPLSPAAL